MSQILIDRELLHRLLNEHLELTVEVRAFRALANRASIGNSGPAIAYARAHKQAAAEERIQVEGSYLLLTDALAEKDDTAVLSLLSSLFPRR